MSSIPKLRRNGVRSLSCWKLIRSPWFVAAEVPQEGGQLEQYVNDRPYAANSFLSVALGRLFSTALSGRSKERQALAESPPRFVAKLPVVAARGGADLVRRLFEPLGVITFQRAAASG